MKLSIGAGCSNIGAGSGGSPAIPDGDGIRDEGWADIPNGDG